MRAGAMRDMRPGEWLMGGSRDPQGEKLYGLGPQGAAQAAVMAYAYAVEETLSPSRKEFVDRLVAAFRDGIAEAVQDPSPH